MPDDAQLIRQFERHYAEQRLEDAEGAQAALERIDIQAQSLINSLEVAGSTHREFEEYFRIAAQSLRDCWHDIKGDLEGSIQRSLG